MAECRKMRQTNETTLLTLDKHIYSQSAVTSHCQPANHGTATREVFLLVNVTVTKTHKSQITTIVNPVKRILFTYSLTIH